MKKYIIGTLIVSFLFIIFLFFSFGNKEETNEKENRFSGSSSSATREALEKDNTDSSLFDPNSGFLDFSGVTDSKPTPQSSQALSPEEKEQRRKLLIQKYKELADRFPGNRYIPREYSPEEREKMERREANMNFIQEKILAREELTPNEQAYFYANKLDEVREKLEILEYAKTKFEETGLLKDATRKILEERIQSIQERRKIYQQELSSAQEKGGNPETYDPF